jgi:DNA-binding response OmpR family regulator
MTLLLADDDTTIVDSLAPFLERAGFQVLLASDGAAALDKIRSHRPNLVVLDVLMPRLDGREVLRRLRQENNWMPTILLTQVGESAERALALEEGADDYLNKPFDPHELLARIRAVLDRKSVV